MRQVLADYLLEVSAGDERMKQSINSEVGDDESQG
jgi:hypothetical protein